MTFSESDVLHKSCEGQDWKYKQCIGKLATCMCSVTQWPFSHQRMNKSSCICLSDANLCCTVIYLFVLTGKSSWKIVFSSGQMSDDLFV